MTTSGGGMLASDDEELIRHARKLSQQAREVWKPMHLQPVFQVEAHGAESKAQSERQRIPARAVGGEVAPQLNTLKGPDSTGQGGFQSNKNRGCPARVIGCEVAEDLFNRGLCLPSGTALTEGDLGRVVETILNSRPG